MQSYEKSSAEQKILIFFMPRRRSFLEQSEKVRAQRAQSYEKSPKASTLSGTFFSCQPLIAIVWVIGIRLSLTDAVGLQHKRRFLLCTL